MASITIRNLDDGLKRRLRVRAAQHGHSMEEEARQILRMAVATRESDNLLDVIRKRFARFGGIDLPIPPRSPIRQPPDFSGPEFGK